jgi:catechol 2,3-dioxygenase-like lactoylglutathione lyase family enzyme
MGEIIYDRVDPGGTMSNIWSGLNHLALITNDMDRTVRFWHGVMGADLVATIGTDTFRHYFFDVGRSTVAFFEYGDNQTEAIAKPAGVFDPRAGHFDHLSLNVADESALMALRQRLLDAECEVTDVVDHGLMKSIYFTDNNGIAMEASYWVNDPTGLPLDLSDGSRFADDNPVAAINELARDGRLHDQPRTKLVDEPTGDLYTVSPG